MPVIPAEAGIHFPQPTQVRVEMSYNWQVNGNCSGRFGRDCFPSAYSVEYLARSRDRGHDPWKSPSSRSRHGLWRPSCSSLCPGFRRRLGNRRCGNRRALQSMPRRGRPQRATGCAFHRRVFRIRYPGSDGDLPGRFPESTQARASRRHRNGHGGDQPLAAGERARSRRPLLRGTSVAAPRAGVRCGPGSARGAHPRRQVQQMPFRRRRSRRGRSSDHGWPVAQVPGNGVRGIRQRARGAWGTR